MYRQTYNRIIIDLDDEYWRKFTERQVREALLALGCEVLTIDPVSLARTRIGNGMYVRNPRVHEAPERVDCSSFMKWVFGQAGLWLPRFTAEQSKTGMSVLLFDDFMPGDLVFMKGPLNWPHVSPSVGHVGLATGEGTIIHASGSKRGIVEDDVSSLSRELETARRILPDAYLTVVIPSSIDAEDDRELRYRIFKHLHRLES